MGHFIEYASAIPLLIFSLFLSACVFWCAIKKGFFRLPHEATPPINISGITVIVFFALYTASFFLLVPLFLKLFSYVFHHAEYPIDKREVLILSLTQFSSVLSAAGMMIAFGWMQPHALMASIWKNPLKAKRPWYSDFGYGIFSWLISFPLVVLIGTIGDIAIAYFFQAYEYEQVAVRFIKKVAPYPEYLYLILSTVIIAAPLIEEFLFRGCLQNWLKRRFGFKIALPIAAIIFATFHMSASQGAGNLPLFASLCVLGMFLGFLYERQGSLFAPIGLHIAFNTLSAFRLVSSL